LLTVNFNISSQNVSKFVHFICLQLVPVFNTGAVGDKASLEKLEEALDILENTLNGQTWVAGNNITIADYSIAVTVSCIEVSFYNFCAFFAHKFGVTDA
jgi:glutathione S-transferase